MVRPKCQLLYGLKHKSEVRRLKNKIQHVTLPYVSPKLDSLGK